jgi:formylglycine-generating enzyme required for sulfatase activity
LPTEAEWERAAHHPKYQLYPWAGAFKPQNANLRGDADGYARPAPVGSFPQGASGLGILDMAGNAAEWCSDWYESTWYQKSPEKNPKGPSEQTGSKVVRGGAHTDNDYLGRTTARASIDPNVANDAVGFRCAADQ